MYDSIKRVKNSAAFNTFIETCEQLKISFQNYFYCLVQEQKKEEKTTKIFSSDNNLQIIIVKFAAYFLGTTLNKR